MLTEFNLFKEAMLKEILQKQASEGYQKQDEPKVDYQPGDRVLVKNMNLVQLLMKQEEHGGTHPEMVTALGKQGFVFKRSPSGDLKIFMADTGIQWVFNPECVQLIEKAKTHSYKVGDRVQFRNIPTEEMEKLQENRGGWIPLLEDMKTRECTIKACFLHALRVEMLDGYEWIVNHELLESVHSDQHKDKRQRQSRCFKEGDKVRIKNMQKDDMKKLSLRHGISWRNKIYNSKELVGEVIGVRHGRIIAIELPNGELIQCCRPCLDLVEMAKPSEDLDQDMDQALHAQLSDMSEPFSTGSRRKVEIRRSFDRIQIAVYAFHTPRDLLAATAGGHVQATMTILKGHPKWANVISENGQHTALMNACASGSIDTVKILIEAGAELDMDNFEGNTATHVAAWMGKKEILKYLLDKGSKSDIKNADGQNALHAAVLGESEDCTKVLLERCSPDDLKLQADDGMTAVELAIRMKNERVCTAIFESTKFDALFQDENGFSAIHHAAVYGNEFAVKKLLEMHPKGLNQQKNDMWTPLHLAAFNNNIDVVKILLQHCDKNIVNEDEETALFLAIKGCYKEVVELLLEANADPNIANEDGETCLHHVFIKLKKAVYESSEATPFYMLAAPLDIGGSPGKKEWLYFGRLLVLNGAKVDVMDTSGKTPLDHITDEVIKAEILTEVEARNTIETSLEDFHDQLKEMSDIECLTKVYQKQNFTARYFDDKGGYMEIEKANVRLYIPPGAVKEPQQLIYIYLDPVSHDVKGKLSPVVEVGPPGTSFNKKVILSYPHCAANESEWKFSTLICEGNAANITNWKSVDEGVESLFKNGRVIIKTPHFTKFTSIGEPKTPEAPVHKNMRIGAFGKDHKHGKTSYQFRVRTWDDTEDATQSIHKKEIEYLKTKPLDDDRPLLVRNTNKDVSVQVGNFNKGWELRIQDCGEQHLKFSDVWENNNPSCTIDLHRTEDSASGTASNGVHCRVKAKQMESPDEDLVHLSISPETSSPSEERAQDPVPKPTLKETLYGRFPTDLPGLPKDLYLDLCGMLNIENDLNGDWRWIMDEMGEGDETTICNIRHLRQAPGEDSPANFALRSYLQRSRAEFGSNNPVKDLIELFVGRHLHEALHYIKQYQCNSNIIC
ncbi:uncharacterized protein [Amphiura filiformis]|uniref:uncharacterized protein isoform X2 n=1 Tax=Amphiura filiformis TaxID=82378 RepID=UPI003B20EAFC